MPAGEPPDGGRHPARRALGAAGLLAAAAANALVAATTTPFTGPADFVTALPIVALAVLVVARWPLRAEPHRHGNTHTPPAHPWLAWIVLGAAIVLWEVAEYAARGSRAGHPTLSSMLDAVDRHEGLKALVFLAWLCLGAAIVRSGARREADAVHGGQPAAVSSALSYAVWAVLGLATAMLWARSRLPGPSPARPAVVLERLATGPFLRIALVLGWMWAGWHLFAR